MSPIGFVILGAQAFELFGDKPRQRRCRVALVVTVFWPLVTFALAVETLADFLERWTDRRDDEP